jgi:hypothetical protein
MTEDAFVWLLVPGIAGGTAATLREAADAAHSAMDEHSDASAMGIFKVHPANDWPYIRLVPEAGRMRCTHEWMTANIARAQEKKKARRKAPQKGHPMSMPATPDGES